MQHLQFEASWDKALAAKDRLKIKNIFDETKDLNHSDCLFSPIREAINHEEALLVTVLIHNFTSHVLSFHNTRLLYSIQGEAIADEIFTLPALMIPSKVSMPWTFIFPKGSYSPRATFENGRLEIL
ncbi:SLAP domain-containing protein [Ureibacillus aquaedulcis]|uniref:SLAP domain-containing protein n=1 Tax=Ureibacillus aquaedulcis TaxID=3058421 RepID=A0ABT8GSY6_9BACL|nr:SLAP domain-containing protein [Ureibacillus sp. BA0131]MDN4494339.1 SLAP domain-containing protein [Ureibacillus sp. BA0131]